jgi:ergot alkaloid biosynthesis protein
MLKEILITGGIGKTGSRLASRLRERGLVPRIASRTAGEGLTRFDWMDSATFAPAVEGIESVYLVAPATADPLMAMRPFLDVALRSGVQRLVFLSSSSLEEGGPMHGQVHQYIKQNAPTWVVLRPTWFMQNFSELQHRATIVGEGVIFSATEDGQVPFIDADDIAAVAAETLTDESFPSGDTILTGPELLTYDQVAAIIASVALYPVRHLRLTEEELARKWVSEGMPDPYAEFLASLDTQIAGGSEAQLTREVERITGYVPNSFRTFAVGAQTAWRPTQPGIFADLENAS